MDRKAVCSQGILVSAQLAIALDIFGFMLGRAFFLSGSTSLTFVNHHNV
jgi:hypothetical protein